jgi:hypothetical protein
MAKKQEYAQNPKKPKGQVARIVAEAQVVEAAWKYAEGLKASIELPTAENNQKLLELGRAMMLKAAGLLSQEDLAKLGEVQRQRMMRDE